MNFTSSDLLLGRQRCRQWAPLLTQQLRLRHVSQIQIFNVAAKKLDSFYFTLHLTTMCAPFYTSEKVNGPNLKWTELDSRIVNNTSASSLVLRVWKSRENEQDRTVLTWGINLSGLVYIGNKIAEVLPFYFKENAVIFYMQGSYFTSQFVIRTDLHKPIPFKDAMNLIGDIGEGKIYRCTSIKMASTEITKSYNLEKLRRLQSLQLAVKRKLDDVKSIKDSIEKRETGGAAVAGNLSSTQSSIPSKVRYEPQLLTMNSLNKMLQEKPSASQIQQMNKIKKEMENVKFKTKLLAHERDRKSVVIRNLKEKCFSKTEENDLRNSDLMENYHSLSRETERLKEIKRNLEHHREIYRQLNVHVQHRRRQLMRQLLFIYPIEKRSDSKYVIHGIYLPNSDILADCSDVGLSVALGYVTHILIMCSSFLQVPLRYPMTHYGSRSYIIDSISPFLQDREREFPLFTRGKEKMQFTYAVYLLNKNLAQLRWLYLMHTPDLKATLPNLLSFLQGPKDQPEVLAALPADLEEELKKSSLDRLVSLRSFGSSSNISDPILDSIKRSGSPRRMKVKCTKELAISEAFLNKQISRDSFKNSVVEGYRNVACWGESSTGSPSTSNNGSSNNLHKLENCDISIEEGTDPLDPASDLSEIITRNIQVYTDTNTKNERRLSRSVGSYTDDDLGLRFKVGSEPHLNTTEHFLDKWLDNGPNMVCSEQGLYPEEILGTSSGVRVPTKPLTARTDALLNTSSFNLVKPKP